MAENDINLAALWMPVMAETSQLKAQLIKGGTEAGAAGGLAMKAAIDKELVGIGKNISNVFAAAGAGADARYVDALMTRWKKLGEVISGASAGASKGMEAFNIAGVAAVAGVGAALVTTTKAAGNFQASQERLVASAGETKAGMDAVSNGILQLAGQVGYSAQQLSDAMYTVEKAGYRGADGVNVLKAAAEGAKSENSDLKEVLGGLTTTMSDFGLKAGAAPDIMSKLVAATGMAKTNFQEFAGALHSVEPIAGAVGQSLDQVGKQHLLADVYGSLAQLTQSGMSAAQAAQNMGRAFTTLSSPTQKMRDELGQLGLNAEDISQHLGERGLSGTLQMISEKIKSQMNPAGQVMIDTFLKSEQVTGAATKMFDAMSPAVKNVAQAVKDGTLSFKEFRKTRGGLSVEQANELQQWIGLENKLKGYSSALKSGQGDIQTYMQALAAATGNQETARAAALLTGEATQGLNNNIKTIDGTTREHDGTVKGFNETQSTLNAKMADAKAAFGAAAIEIGTAFIPVMTDVANIAKDVGDAMAKHPAIVHDVVDALELMAGAWLVMKGYNIASTVLGPIAKAFGGINTAAAEANATMKASGAAAKEGAAGVEAAAAEEVAAEKGVAEAAVGADATLAAGGKGPVPVPKDPAPGGSSWMKNLAGVVPQALVGLQLGDDVRKHLTDDTPPDQKKAVDDWLKGGKAPNFGHAAGGQIMGSGPKGKDSVPAWLAPGEHVLTADEVDKMGGQQNVYAFRKALHRQGGGGIPGFDKGGAPGTQDWLNQQLQARGLSPDEAKGILAMNQVEGGASSPMSLLGFTEGQAHGPQGHVNAFMGQWNDPSRRGPGGAIPGVGQGGNVGDWNQYMTWIRQRIVGQNGAPSDWQGNAQPPAAVYQNALMTALHGGNGALTPPGGPGGAQIGTAGNPLYTTHSRETADRADARVKEIQEHIAELKPDAKQSTKDRLNDELRFAKEDQARAHDKLAQEPEETGGGTPGGRGSRSGSGRAGGDDKHDGSYEGGSGRGEQSGSGFVSGIMSDLGFGNVFGGKSPLEWPLVKMFTGLASAGLSAGNMWAESKMGGGAGPSGIADTGGGIPGFNSGQMGSGAGANGLGDLDAGLGSGQSSADATLGNFGKVAGGGSSKGWFGDLATSPMLSVQKLSKGWFGSGPNATPVTGLPAGSGGGKPTWQGMAVPGLPGSPTPGTPDWVQQSMQGLAHPGTPQNFMPPLLGVVPGVGGVGDKGSAPPMPSYSGGPQLVPSSVASTPTAADRGNLGVGGNTVHNDNRIVVQGNTMTKPEQLAGPMQEQRNSQIYQRSQFGGLPMTAGPGGG